MLFGSLSEPAVSTVIPGMRSIRGVERNLATLELGALPDEQRDKLRGHRRLRNLYR
jgi:aryl-alcohol dehydrogenase-like predicted oxidoreductase